MNKILEYLKNSREELAKVSWPSKDQTMNSTILVIFVSVAIASFLGGADYGLSKALEWALARVNF
jgi:preprotein translocase subunit SecE